MKKESKMTNNNGLTGEQFDKKAIFESKCRDLLNELVLRCSIYRIPFFWTAAVANNSEGTEYIRDAVGIASRKITLADDQISKHLAVSAGFDVTNRDEMVEVLMGSEALKDEDDIFSDIEIEME